MTRALTRVLLLSHMTGYQLHAFNDAAEALGIELVFATDRCHQLEDPWQDRAIPVRFHDVDGSVDAIYERVGVRGGGCSGFSYLLDLTEEEAGEQDEAMESHGVPMLVDMKSLLYLDGTEIDFRDEVMGRGFVFKNPNATSSCGCGSSFTA